MMKFLKYSDTMNAAEQHENKHNLLIGKLIFDKIEQKTNGWLTTADVCSVDSVPDWTLLQESFCTEI